MMRTLRYYAKKLRLPIIVCIFFSSPIHSKLRSNNRAKMVRSIYLCPTDEPVVGVSIDRCITKIVDCPDPFVREHDQKGVRYH